jgi:hypothetical protein
MLENLVRPLLPANLRPAPWPSQRKSKADDDFAELTIAGGSGQVIVSSDSWSNNSQWTYNDVGEVEAEREAAPLRIKNPDDPSQHIDTDQMEMMKLKSRRNQKNPRGLKLAEVEENETVERRGPNQTKKSRF